jgi:hypothetical protein
MRPVHQVSATGAAPAPAPAWAGAQPAPAPAPAPAPGPDEVRIEVGPGHAPARRTGRVLAAVGSAVVVVGAIVAAVVLGGGGSQGSPQDDETDFVPPAPTVAAVVPSPTNLFGARQEDGTVVFTWTNPSEEDGDRYLWGVLAATGEPTLTLVDEPTVTVTPDVAGGEVCIEVSIVRADRRASATPVEGCAS